MDQKWRRRDLLRGTALAAGYQATARGYPANETIQVGCIGTGGRCRELMRALQRIPGVRIAAVADIWDVNLAEGRKLADPKAFATKDYRELLRRSDVDAVVIGTPDHWHTPMTIDACAAGKDVYVEKPLTHELAEGPKVIAAQNTHRRIVQVGMQQRSMPHLQKAREIVQSGKLGRIRKVHMTWNRNTPSRGRTSYNIDPATVDWKAFLGGAPAQPFNEYRLRNWRWFWDFGGGTLTDLMVHWMDVVNWYLDLEVPASATSMGDNFHAKDLWETPDTMQTLLQYPDKEVQAYFESTFVNARNGAMTEFMGTEATLYIDRGRYEIHPERKRGSRGEVVENPLPASELVLGSGPRGQDFYDNPNGEILHLTNWLECVRTRQRPNAPAEAGVSAAAAAHLGNIAYRTGQVARWTAAAQAGFQPLFNGNDLNGWEQDTPGIWSARDGMIVGKTQGLKHNDFLRTRKIYKDFTLRLSFRLVSGTGNSGIQFRSQPVPGSHEVSGYQADIGESYWGCLYDESRRRRVLAQASPASLSGLRRDGWNEYVITARGNHITLDLNGVRTVDYQEKEPGMDAPGLIALQVHSGPPLEVQFKDIRIREH